MNKELVEDTQRFLRDLNGLLIHIGIYLVGNITLTLFIFSDFSKYWWLLFPVIVWSLLLIYHALQMAEKKKTTVVKLLSALVGIS